MGAKLILGTRLIVKTQDAGTSFVLAGWPASHTGSRTKSYPRGIQQQGWIGPLRLIGLIGHISIGCQIIV